MDFTHATSKRAASNQKQNDCVAPCVWALGHGPRGVLLLLLRAEWRRVMEGMRLTCSREHRVFYSNR